jgi:hypothetical protein
MQQPLIVMAMMDRSLFEGASRVRTRHGTNVWNVCRAPELRRANFHGRDTFFGRFDQVPCCLAMQ